MSEGTSLDDLLNGDAEPETPEPQIEATSEAEPETIGQPRLPNGQFAPKEATGVEAVQEPVQEPVPPTEQTGLPPAEYAALRDERRKRQEAEARIAALEQQFQAMQPRQPEEAIDFWDNPQAVIGQQFQQFKQQLREELRQEQITERIDASETAARAKYADYDDAFHAFRQAVQVNPVLVQQMTQSADPADFAYKTGKRAMDLERVGSIDGLIQSERAKWEAEARAAIAPAPLSLPSTTATDSSVGGRSGPAWAGISPIGDLLK